MNVKRFHLVDYDHGKQAILQDRLYQMASRIALKYGSSGNGGLKYNRDQICEFWNYDAPYPSLQYVRSQAKVKSIKWYIHNKISIDSSMWNSDFLHGLMIHCKMLRHSSCFPSCEWYGNDKIASLVKSCPFGGRLNKNEQRQKQRYRWSGVPALLLKYSKDSLSFMAGAMAGLQIYDINGVAYARFNKRALPYFQQWGIPVERMFNKDVVLISPIWPALFINHMPTEFIPDWLNVVNPCNANIYAPILWKTYLNNEFVSNGLPYLKSRRMIYYDFDCEEGAMKYLNKLRVTKGLTTLDNRIRTVVQEWGKECEIPVNRC